jgi:hypothetical protein
MFEQPSKSPSAPAAAHSSCSGHSRNRNALCPPGLLRHARSGYIRITRTPASAILPHATPPPRRTPAAPSVKPDRHLLGPCVCTCFAPLSPYIHHPKSRPTLPLSTMAQTMGPDHCRLPYTTPALQIDEHSALARDKILTSHTIPLRNAWTPPPSSCARHQ